MMDQARQILRKYWGHPTFREPQEQIIQSVLSGEHCLAVLPTGGGKSLCYQLPTLMLPGVTLVISPLIALMEDQVQQLASKGLKAMNLSDARSKQDLITAFDNILYGNYQFIYCSPEKLQSDIVQERLKSLPIDLIAIDEAHCISQWGHDFRPSYTKLNILFDLFPNAVRLALTATATAPVIKDIRKYLQLDDGRLFMRSAYRSSIEIEVTNRAANADALIEILQDSKGSCIIYAGTRKKCHRVHQFLVRNNFASSFYHGGLDRKQRSEALEQWISGSSRIMVATNAFGMGIDKSDVRLVVHLHLPFSLENYQQEIGRAGRDGAPAKAITLLNEQQLLEQQEFVEKNLVDALFCKNIYQRLNNFFEIALGHFEDRAFVFSIQEFSDTYNFSSVQVYNALTHLEQEGVIQLVTNRQGKARARILIDHNIHIVFNGLSSTDRSIIQQLLRNYEGIKDRSVLINEPHIARQLEIKVVELQELLGSLQRLGMIDYIPASATDKIEFLVPREDDYVYHLIRDGIKSRNQMKIEKARSVRSFVTNNEVCRWRALLSYFNEEIKDCGNCDRCKRDPRNEYDHHKMAKKIFSLLEETEPLEIGTLVRKLKAPKEFIIKTLEMMKDQGDIQLTLYNKIERNI